ncbi:MAG: TIGR03905 family TSCPD domain-containing protein [Oscillospiraceae bacterium]|nr:TIGR03905 family TSCPD domain-containing protein [Oscillospiraceae bacterium]
MTATYKTTGTCARKIDIDVKDRAIVKVIFDGGCEGNLKGISQLVKGMDASEAIGRLEGIKCGQRGTSCPDQLAKALKEML